MPANDSGARIQSANSDEVPLDDPPRRDRKSNRAFTAATGACLLASGAVVLTVSLTTFNGLWSLVCTAASLFLLYAGIGRASTAATGRRCDVVFGLAIGWLILVGGTAVLAPVLPLGEHVDTAKTIGVASFRRPDIFSSHPLGTNQFGLDILARTVWGARDSLVTATVAIVLGTLVGGCVGIAAGYFRGATDRLIGVVTTLGLAFPPLVLLMLAASLFGHGGASVSLALALLVTPGTIRFARANAMAEAARDHVFSSYILGSTPTRIIIREVAPRVGASLVTLAFLTMPFLLVAQASLSYLGLGVPPPAPTWGNMIAEGNGGVVESNPHVVLIPGAALLLTVLSLNVIGRRLQVKWDPRQAKLL